MRTLPDAKQDALFTMAYREYAQELIRHAQVMVDSRELSEDLVQDVFLKVWLYIVRGGQIEKMRAFLHHALHNVIVDTYRKHKTLSLDALLERGQEPSVDESKRMFDILDGRRAFVLIDKLPPTYQRVLRMKYARDLSYQEASLATEQSRNTIAVQVHRGIEKLRLLYSPV